MEQKPGIYPTWTGWLFPLLLGLLALSFGGLIALIIYRVVGALTF